MTTSAPPARPTPDVVAALKRYRVGAWVVGVGLLVLVLIGMPLKYLAGDGTVVAIVGPIHGFLYMGYLLLTADLAYRDRWPVGPRGARGAGGHDPVRLVRRRAEDHAPAARRDVGRTPGTSSVHPMRARTASPS